MSKSKPKPVVTPPPATPAESKDPESSENKTEEKGEGKDESK